MSDVQPNPGASADDDLFLSGDGTPTFGGFAYTDESGKVDTVTSEITGDAPGKKKASTQSTTDTSGFAGWTCCTEFTETIAAQEGVINTTTYQDDPTSRPVHEGMTWYLTSAAANTVQSSTSSNEITTTVTRNWQQFQNSSS